MSEALLHRFLHVLLVEWDIKIICLILSRTGYQTFCCQLFYGSIISSLS